MKIINEQIDKITTEVAHKLDEQIKCCFELLGYDMKYLREHSDEFWIEQFPNGNRVFYRGEDKLFTACQKTDLDFEKGTVTISQTIEWHKSKEGEENGS